MPQGYHGGQANQGTQQQEKVQKTNRREWKVLVDVGDINVLQLRQFGSWGIVYQNTCLVCCWNSCMEIQEGICLNFNFKSFPEEYVGK